MEKKQKKKEEEHELKNNIKNISWVNRKKQREANNVTI
jgi:hypothetical protein